MEATVTIEAKAKVKTEAKDKEVQENQEDLKYKVWVLKVPIHCETCKKKVKKILKDIDGVYKTNIDLRQHKVIVTGDVDVQTLIRKLEKNGKRAELWPEIKAEKKKKKKSKAKKKEKQQLQSDQESSEEGNDSASAAGSGSGGKKKKKKAHKGNNGNTNATAVEVEPCGEAGTGLLTIPARCQCAMSPPACYSRPRQHGYNYPPPPHFYAPPGNVVSYNTPCAGTRYHASHCAAQTPHSYPYMHPGTGTELPSSDINSYPSQPCNSFEIFSDENPNACSIM